MKKKTTKEIKILVDFCSLDDIFSYNNESNEKFSYLYIYSFVLLTLIKKD